MNPVALISIIVLIAMVAIIVAGKVSTPQMQRLVVVAEMSIAFCAIAIYGVTEIDKLYSQGAEALNTGISMIIIKVILLAGAVLVSGGLLLNILKSERDVSPRDSETP